MNFDAKHSKLSYLCAKYLKCIWFFPKTFEMFLIFSENIRPNSCLCAKHSRCLLLVQNIQKVPPVLSPQFLKSIWTIWFLSKIFNRYSIGIKTLPWSLEKYLILAWKTQNVLNFYAKIEKVSYFVKITFEKYLVLTPKHLKIQSFYTKRSISIVSVHKIFEKYLVFAQNIRQMLNLYANIRKTPYLYQNTRKVFEFL